MIASHNSLTFLRPRRWWLRATERLHSWLWRCQRRDIRAQIEAGARYFDFRVRYDSRREKWRACHGLIDLDLEFDNLRQVAALAKGYPCRVVLERASTGGRWRMANFAYDTKNNESTNVTLVARKRPWTELYRFPRTEDAVFDRFFKPFDTAKPLRVNLLNLLLHPSTIARYAKEHPLDDFRRSEDAKLYYMIDLI